MDQIGHLPNTVQDIYLAERTEMKTIARKILYAMGRHSEISRRDRDLYVTIMPDNIKRSKYWFCTTCTVHALNMCVAT